jgi:signal transduction histidine kinase
MKKKQYQQALECFQQSFALADTTMNRFLYNNYKFLAQASAYAGKSKETYDYIEMFANSAEKAFKEEWSARVTEMEVKYETGKKQLEIEQQKNTINKQNMQRRILTGSVVLSGIILVLLWYMLRLRNRRNRALAERTNALAEMNATKDKFFSIVSHDLRNPAVSQRDAIQLLVNNARMWDVDTLSDYYHELLKSADAQVELVHTLLDWARLQTGRMSFTPETFNFASRFRSDISLVRSMSEKKGITFHIAIPDDAQITGDGNMLSAIVRNLLTNAVKFTASGGTVSLTVEPAVDGKYTVTVSDTGTGMSREQAQKLFRLDSAQSRKGTSAEQGTGLGLIICRELLEKHKTTLHVESEEGKGSRFWFEI